jgi:hypothetical protein
MEHFQTFFNSCFDDIRLCSDDARLLCALTLLFLLLQTIKICH